MVLELGLEHIDQGFARGIPCTGTSMSKSREGGDDSGCSTWLSHHSIRGEQWEVRKGN